MRPCLRAVLGCAGLVLAAPAFCQLIPLNQGLTPVAAPKPAGLEWRHPHGLLYFNTNIGSFKLVSNADDPSEGTLDFAFKGTVLISDMDPASRLILKGNIRKEIDDKSNRKLVYFGEGRMTLTGRYRAVQFFGRNLRGSFNGKGILRVIGEFDKNLDTGMWWYAGVSKNYWNTSITNIPVPQTSMPKPNIIVTPKKSGG